MDLDDELLLEELMDEVNFLSMDLLHDYIDSCVLEFKRAIDIAVYSYDPTWWNPEKGERTREFINSVEGEVRLEGGKPVLYIKIDTDKLEYFSWTYKGETTKNVSQYVPWWIQEGHHDGSPYTNEYHNYEGRDYLGMAKELIMSDLIELGVHVEIINDKPNY